MICRPSHFVISSPSRLHDVAVRVVAAVTHHITRGCLMSTHSSSSSSIILSSSITSQTKRQLMIPDFYSCLPLSSGLLVISLKGPAIAWLSSVRAGLLEPYPCPRNIGRYIIPFTANTTPHRNHHTSMSGSLVLIISSASRACSARGSR